MDRDIIEGMVLPADFMFYCRECYIEKIGFQVPGHFGDYSRYMKWAYSLAGGMALSRVEIS
jgi:hypothetical protein